MTAIAASRSSISISVLSSTILQSLGLPLRCQLPGQRIGWLIGTPEGSAPAIADANARASFSLACSSGVLVGVARRQCRCSLSSTSPVLELVHTPPLATTTVAGPSFASRFARPSLGFLSQSTVSVSPSQMSACWAVFLSRNVQIGGQNTAVLGWFAALLASSSATSAMRI